MTLLISQTQPDAIELAAASLLRGELIIYPTETFYGLGADARSAAAVEALCRLKGREEGKPLPVILPPGGAELIAARLSDVARGLIARFWPGPLTLVFEGRKGFPAELYGPGGTIGGRVPGGEFALRLATRCGWPIVSTSANRAGLPAPADLIELDPRLAAGAALMIDGGALPGRLGSTVVDVSGTLPRLLRRGALDLPGL